MDATVFFKKTTKITAALKTVAFMPQRAWLNLPSLHDQIMKF
jgi:hypothetical protein